MASKTKLLAFYLGILLCLSLVMANPAQAVSIIEGFFHPESITADSSRIFVSNIGQTMEPTAKDGDGFITELSTNGVLVRNFTAKGVLNAPKGLTVGGNTLYVADIDHIAGFNLQNGEQVFSLDLSSETSFLNDLAAIDEQTLLASASDTGTVYCISTLDRRFSPLPGRIPGANGISYDARTQNVYVVGLGEDFNGQGEIYELAIADPTAHFEQIEVPPGFFDGVTRLEGDRLIYSDWVEIQKPTLGAVYIYNFSTKQVEALPLPVKSHGPADFYYQPTTNSLWLPLALDNKVAILEVY